MRNYSFWPTVPQIVVKRSYNRYPVSLNEDEVACMLSFTTLKDNTMSTHEGLVIIDSKCRQTLNTVTCDGVFLSKGAFLCALLAACIEGRNSVYRNG